MKIPEERPGALDVTQCGGYAPNVVKESIGVLHVVAPGAQHGVRGQRTGVNGGGLFHGALRPLALAKGPQRHTTDNKQNRANNDATN
jgi:hypothetical protein